MGVAHRLYIAPSGLGRQAMKGRHRKALLLARVCNSCF